MVAFDEIMSSTSYPDYSTEVHPICYVSIVAKPCIEIC